MEGVSGGVCDNGWRESVGGCVTMDGVSGRVHDDGWRKSVEGCVTMDGGSQWKGACR